MFIMRFAHTCLLLQVGLACTLLGSGDIINAHGPVAAVARAFAVTLQTFEHPRHHGAIVRTSTLACIRLRLRLSSKF